MTERTRNELLDELVRMTNARDLLANTADRLIAERDAARRQLKGAVDAERARIIAKIRHVAAGHLSPDDPWGAALRQIADILETERGQSETAPASDELQAPEGNDG